MRNSKSEFRVRTKKSAVRSIQNFVSTSPVSLVLHPSSSNSTVSAREENHLRCGRVIIFLFFFHPSAEALDQTRHDDGHPWSIVAILSDGNITIIDLERYTYSMVRYIFDSGAFWLKAMTMVAVELFCAGISWGPLSFSVCVLFIITQGFIRFLFFFSVCSSRPFVPLQRAGFTGRLPPVLFCFIPVRAGAWRKIHIPRRTEIFFWGKNEGDCLLWWHADYCAVRERRDSCQGFSWWGDSPLQASHGKGKKLLFFPCRKR